MVPFNKITETDTPKILSFFDADAQDRVKLALNRYCSGGRSELSMAVVEQAIVFRQEIEDMYLYSMPKGKGNIRIICMEMMEGANIMGYDWMVVGVNEAQKAIINGALPGHFKFISEEKYSFLDIVRFCKIIDNEPSIIAKPTVSYTDSVFYNNEKMVAAV